MLRRTEGGVGCLWRRTLGVGGRCEGVGLTGEGAGACYEEGFHGDGQVVDQVESARGEEDAGCTGGEADGAAEETAFHGGTVF